MASSRILGFPVNLLRPKRYKTRQCLQVRAHGPYGDHEGNPKFMLERSQKGFFDLLLSHRGRSKKHIVDANMQLLRERMEEIRVKEHLERCIPGEHLNGWNYIPAAGDCKQKQGLKAFHDFSQLAATVFATFGFTILSGTICLCVASILVHLSQ